MKKMLLLLAGMACLGMFVSCSDDPQEVVVSYDRDSMEGYEYTYYGTATGTVVSSDSSSTVTVDSEKPFAVVSYEDNVGKQTNVKEYALTVPVKVTETYYSGAFTRTVYPKITLLDVNGTYYCGKEEIKANASPKSSEFTLTGTMKVSNDGTTYTFSTITFKRK